MDITRACSKPLVMLNSVAIVSRAGATIVEASGEMKVKQATIKVAVQRLCRGQFKGFSGSSSPIQATFRRYFSGGAIDERCSGKHYQVLIFFSLLRLIELL